MCLVCGTLVNVVKVTDTSCCMCIGSGVKQACSEFLEKQLDPSNCLGIRIFAESHGCENLQQAAELFTYKHFEEVVLCEEFHKLDIKDVKKLVESDEIQVIEPIFC